MKTLKEIYKNSSDEVREILESKFNHIELGIKLDENQIKKEILDLVKNNIKNVRFLSENGNRINLPSKRFEITNDDEDWLFEINYNEESKYFWYSNWRVYGIFESKYGINYLKFNEIMKDILEEELNLEDITPQKRRHGAKHIGRRAKFRGYYTLGAVGYGPMVYWKKS